MLLWDIPVSVFFVSWSLLVLCLVCNLSRRSLSDLTKWVFFKNCSGNNFSTILNRILNKYKLRVIFSRELFLANFKWESLEKEHISWVNVVLSFLFFLSYFVCLLLVETERRMFRNCVLNRKVSDCCRQCTWGPLSVHFLSLLSKRI